jgi:hypothetical protein
MPNITARQNIAVDALMHSVEAPGFKREQLAQLDCGELLAAGMLMLNVDNIVCDNEFALGARLYEARLVWADIGRRCKLIQEFTYITFEYGMATFDWLQAVDLALIGNYLQETTFMPAYMYADQVLAAYSELAEDELVGPGDHMQGKAELHTLSDQHRQVWSGELVGWLMQTNTN